MPLLVEGHQGNDWRFDFKVQLKRLLNRRLHRPESERPRIKFNFHPTSKLVLAILLTRIELLLVASFRGDQHLSAMIPPV